jgi:hypothetical protein
MTSASWGLGLWIAGIAAALAALAVPAWAQQKPDYSRLLPVLKGRIPTQVPEFPFAAFHQIHERGTVRGTCLARQTLSSTITSRAMQMESVRCNVFEARLKSCW